MPFTSSRLIYKKIIFWVRTLNKRPDIQYVFGFVCFLLYNYRINSDAKMEMDGLNTRRGYQIGLSIDSHDN